jgi:hypothetical protein
MSKVDDELTRRLRRAERPVDVDDLFEGLERRRSHRERVRRVQGAVLVLAVLASTAGGFLFLRHAFDPDKRNVGDEQTPAVTKGEIVFARDGVDGFSHLYGAHSDGSGVRQITDGVTNDTDPVVSPNGKTIAYVHELEKGIRVIATIPIAGGRIAWHSRDDLGAGDPTWSPDGSEVLFVGDYSGLYALSSNGSDLRTVLTFIKSQIADPSWSPDGSMIVFSGPDGSLPAGAPWSLIAVTADGKQFIGNVPGSNEDARAPAWSPDGSLIAFLAPHGLGVGVFTVPASAGLPVGGEPSLIATAAHLEHDLTWAPDGSSLLVSDGDWIYRVDATPDGDPRDNFVQLVRGVSPSWQPIPAGSELTPTISPQPSPSPSPEPEGKDVGLSFTLCDSQALGGVDFLGDGTAGTTWIGVPTNEDGTCPRYSRPGRYVVAEDHTGDGVADSWLDLPWRCDLDCVPFDATDLDANGTEELVIASYFSIMDYHVMGLQPNAEGALEIRPLLVAEPGHQPVGLIAGEPIRIDAGGDEGYGSQIECEGYPDAPVLIWSWSNQPVETNLPREVHITRLQLRSDGLFHVLATNDYSVPADQPSGIQRSTAPACGVDFHPDA